MKRDDIVYNSQETAERIKLRAKVCGTTMKSMLSNLELGINIVSQLAKGQEMSYLNLAKIADYLSCSVDYLLGRTDNPEVAHSQQYQNKNGVQVVSSHDTNVSYHNSSDCCMQDKELLELFQRLTLKQKAKTVTFIYEMIEAKQ